MLLVTDAGLAAAGHERHSQRVLEAAGVRVTVYDEVHANPTTEDVDHCLKVAQSADVNLIVGLGGGSSMDCAKGCNFLLTNGGRMEDYWGVGKARHAMLPMIAVPTTAGTGSEAQSFALIAQADSHMKMACGDKKAACRIAVLDPQLTLSMPDTVTAATGVDAIAHAVETYVTKPRNAVSQLFSRKAWQLLSRSFARVLKHPNDLDARGDMLLGAHFAGAAIENSMLGATHALANPLSAHFDTTHGVAIGIMLPHVVRFNSEFVDPLYADLVSDASRAAPEFVPETGTAGERLAECLTRLVRQSGLPTRLSQTKFDPDLIPTLAEEAAKQWTGTFNPRPVSIPEFEQLYHAARG